MRYTFFNKITGVEHGTFTAHDPVEAREELAKAEGYPTWDELVQSQDAGEIDPVRLGWMHEYDDGRVIVRPAITGYEALVDGVPVEGRYATPRAAYIATRMNPLERSALAKKGCIKHRDLLPSQTSYSLPWDEVGGAVFFPHRSNLLEKVCQLLVSSTLRWLFENEHFLMLEHDSFRYGGRYTTQEEQSAVRQRCYRYLMEAASELAPERDFRIRRALILAARDRAHTIFWDGWEHFKQHSASQRAPRRYPDVRHASGCPYAPGEVIEPGHLCIVCLATAPVDEPDLIDEDPLPDGFTLKAESGGYAVVRRGGVLAQYEPAPRWLCAERAWQAYAIHKARAQLFCNKWNREKPGLNAYTCWLQARSQARSLEEVREWIRPETDKIRVIAPGLLEDLEIRIESRRRFERGQSGDEDEKFARE